ncbi:MAG: hypothetical protein P8188_17460 [Gemmatimonadota bacterium]
MEGYLKVSPDGRRLAYVSDRYGPSAVYLRSWPDLADETRISPEGQDVDQALTWTPDGDLAFVHRVTRTDGPQTTIQVAGLDREGDGPPRPTRIDTVLVRPVPAYISGTPLPDGRILLVSQGGPLDPETPDDALPPRLRVITNWLDRVEGRTGS